MTIINEKAYQLDNNVFQRKGEYYAPLDDFLVLLTQHTNTDYSMDYDSMSISLDGVVQNAPELKTTDLAEEKKKWQFDTIIIDPGHGGKDPGTAGKNIVEKHLVLKIAKRLVNTINAEKSMSAFLTRDGDYFPCPQNRKSCDQKTSLNERLDIAKKGGAEVILDKDLTPEILSKAIKEIFLKEGKLSEMAEAAFDQTFVNATENITKYCYKMIEKPLLISSIIGPE